MNVGMPGAGLGGLFFLACALLTIPVELARTIAGRGSKARWKRAFRHTTLAGAILGVLALTYWGVRMITEQKNAQESPFQAIPVAPVVTTVGILVLILALAYLLRLVIRPRAGVGES